MRSCCAIYIDAGYLLAASAMLVSGTSLRASVEVNHSALITDLVAQAEKMSGMPLMRVNWYDSGNGPAGNPDSDQTAIAMMPRVKLRLGRRSFSGEQKGVDLRLGLDLVTHARNRAIDIAYLLSGDDDLTEAVEEAQFHGVQVQVLAVPDPEGLPYAVARHLQMEADGVLVIDKDTVARTVTRAPRPAEKLTSETRRQDQAATAMRAMSALPSDAEVAAGKQDSAAPRPTPAIMSRIRGAVASGQQPSDVTPVVAPSKIVYSTSRMGDEVVTSGNVPILGHEGEYELRDADPESIEAVCRSVLAVWLDSANDEDKEQLLRNRPSIPADVDRALLRDLSLRINVYEIVEEDRHALRAHFWVVADDMLD